MALNEAPIKTPVVNSDRIMTPPWVEYEYRLSTGDIGTSFTPTINSLTVVGTPVISGVYYENQGFTDFYVKIVPVTSTASTAGVTNFVLPFNVSADSACFAVLGFAGGVGAINAASKTVYPPGWAATANPVTISGRVKS